jgi:signal transduction histidine kinase
MKRLKIPSEAIKPDIFPAAPFILTVALFLLLMSDVLAQEKQMIQVRTFDQQLQPMKNIEVSINGHDYVAMGNKGTAFTELTTGELPPKTVKIKNEQLEPASWNYSKGILEIVVRKKNYQIVHVLIRDDLGNTQQHTTVQFNGRRPITVTSNGEGMIEIPLALDEKVASKEQFVIEGKRIRELNSSTSPIVLVIESPGNGKEAEADEKPITSKEYFRNFDLSKLDSIQSLTMFYAVFKKYSINDLNPETRRKVDAKFTELVAELSDSTPRTVVPIFRHITDSTLVADDIRNLLQQATLENQTLQSQRAEFDEKIKLINDKLAEGVGNLPADEKSKLLADITRLENLLTANEGRFFKNQNDYRQIINSLKEKFFDVESLENQLSISEAQRQEEQRVFRQRLFAITGVVIVFGILIVLLISFSNKLKKQKRKLEEANTAIRHINENLENMVLQRTRLLQEANRELDTFLYRASHDLRSPVCSIIGLCNIASHLSPRELVERVENTTSSMDRLLRKLCMISEINQPTEFNEVSLYEIARNIEMRFGPEIRQADIQFHIDCDHDLVLETYPAILETVLANLVENALFYSVLRNPNHARVEVKAELKEDHLLISVYDNGVGIDPAMQQRMFDMFFKGNERSRGNGLGLYIVNKSVQAMDGKIRVESEPGRYTKVTVRIPLHHQRASRTLVPAELN